MGKRTGQSWKTNWLRLFLVKIFGTITAEVLTISGGKSPKFLGAIGEGDKTSIAQVERTEGSGLGNAYREG